jgi:hypothetical protein
MLGNEFAIFVDMAKEAGCHSIDFNAIDLPSRVYFYKLQTGNFIITKKILFLR